MFAHIRDAMSNEELIELGGKVESVKKIAPTRPHPMTPNEPGIRKAATPIVSLVDRMRDAVSGRGSES